VLAALRAGGAVGLAADQDAGANGVFVDFLGERASTARGPALFALRSGAPLFAVACLAVEGRPRRYRVHIEEIPCRRSGDLEADVSRLTQAHADFVARFVREAPEQYFWVHKRWKTRPGGPPTGSG
jgi:KDO2-lipid IV(A) lauroyltransferase